MCSDLHSGTTACAPVVAFVSYPMPLAPADCGKSNGSSIAIVAVVRPYLSSLTCLLLGLRQGILQSRPIAVLGMS